MSLWSRRDMRDALWAARTTRPPHVAASADAAPALVRVSHLTRDEVEEMPRRPLFMGMGRGPLDDPVRDAWVELVRSKMAGEDVCFFTGTYRDDYGYSFGLMKAHNVQRDWRRFLREQGLEDNSWVCAVESHKYRVVLHLHALLAGVSQERADQLAHAWNESRGWSSAPRCTDGGVAYTCKYALKAAEGDSFEWCWS